MESISPARLYEDQKEELHLELLTESLASRREITVSDTNRPGMALMGFVENFLSERIQILAQTEFAYLATLPEAKMREAVDRLFQFSIPLIVVCKALNVPPYLIQRANECQVPVLRTPREHDAVHPQPDALPGPHVRADDVGPRLAGGRLRLRAAVHRAAAGSASRRPRSTWSSAATGWWPTTS